jgi:hypothetical protein
MGVKGGQKFEAYLGEVGKKLSGSRVVRVGFLSGATYPNGLSVALVAFWNEFGTKFAPARPFFRNMIAAKKNEWPNGIATQLKLTGFNVDLALRRTGEAIAGQLRESIINTNFPPNAESTIERKGHSKPLVGAPPSKGHMLGSVDYEVADKA